MAIQKRPLVDEQSGSRENSHIVRLLVPRSGKKLIQMRRCTACREGKTKCSGEQPCRYCTKRNLECVVPENSKRKLYSVAFVLRAAGDSVCADVPLDTFKTWKGEIFSQGSSRRENGRVTPAVSWQEETGEIYIGPEPSTHINGEGVGSSSNDRVVASESFREHNFHEC
jgi:proline utilization trans-activator